MSGVLLDTHALYWLVTSAGELSRDSLLAIAESQTAGHLLVSPITAWELAIACRKANSQNRPQLGSLTPSLWFSSALAATGASLVPINEPIAFAAAQVSVDTGHKDPGDCFLMATAHVCQVPLVTRDRLIRGMASRDYLQVITC